MKKLFLVAIMAVFAFTIGNAQEQTVAEEQTVQISLPKYCCSESDALIEKTLAYEKGVESFQLNPITKSVLVTFKTKKTNQMKIEKALAKAGFETPNCKANERAVAKLPTCCKNTARGIESNCGHNHNHSHSHDHQHGHDCNHDHNHEHNHDCDHKH
jgi:copper chaperone CopZ